MRHPKEGRMRKRKPKSKNEPNAKEPPHKVESEETPGRVPTSSEEGGEEERVDEASQESFPASDPPAHRGHHI